MGHFIIFYFSDDLMLDRETGGGNIWQDSWMEEAFLGSSRDGQGQQEACALPFCTSPVSTNLL